MSILFKSYLNARVRRFRVATVALALLAITGDGSPVLAADLGRFEGRTIEFIVGSKPGGGYDRTTRLVAEHMERILPGSNIVVANQDRMGGIVALNRLSQTTSSKPIIMMYNTGLILTQIAGDDMLRADLTSMEYIGKVTSEARYLVASTRSGINSWEDVLEYQDPILMPAQTRVSSGYIQSMMVGKAFEVNFKPITGFSGSESRAGLAKGELQMDLISENNV
ncbi:MAG: hypothetical protein ACR2O1_02850, partial [Boseongicola sp.]